MKVSGRKVAEHRAALVVTARRLLQERGFSGAGVADISREAGLTQGALYAQFGSKDALAAEAACRAVAEGAAFLKKLREAPDPLAAYLDAYLDESHMRDAGAGCLMAACVSEVARQDKAIGAAFAQGFRDLVAFVMEALPKGLSREESHRRALTMVPAMVGSVAIARALEKTDPALAREVLVATRVELERLAAGVDAGR